MNHIQRQMIKEAYQEGYQEALHENRFLNRIKRFFGFDTMPDITKAKRRGIVRIPPIGPGSPFPEGDNPGAILKWIRLNVIQKMNPAEVNLSKEDLFRLKLFGELLKEEAAGLISQEQLMMGIRAIFPDLPWGDRYLPPDGPFDIFGDLP